MNGLILSTKTAFKIKNVFDFLPIQIEIILNMVCAIIL